MITKHESYWHLYFNEECADDPAAILAKVEALFKEISEMGDLAYFRIRPSIEREKVFESDETKVHVRCRISTPAPQIPDPPAFIGLREDPQE